MSDPKQSLDDLLARVEPALRSRFLEIIVAAKAALDLDALATLLEAGRLYEALKLVENVGAALASETTKAFILAGDETAAFLADALEVIVSFDGVNDNAVAILRRARFDLITEFTRQQEEATRFAILDAVRRGLNPLDQARLFRDSIGLTSAQQRMVDNFRRLLEDDPRSALLRELRDGRSDRTIEAALRSGTPLTRAQIDRMVERYRDNMIALRAETIARTESLAAVHGGNHEMFRQAIASGQLDERELYRTWITAKDARVRDSHSTMEGQERDGLTAFVSGAGNRLRFPGDPDAPARDRIQCRCSVVSQLRLFSLSEETFSPRQVAV